MSRNRLGLFLFLVCLGGCPATTPNDPQSVGRVAAGVTNGQNKGGNVRVRINNFSGFRAEVRVTMRLDGERVRFANRELAVGELSEIVGPDRADTVTVEVRVLAAAPFSEPVRSFSLGEDFSAGQTINVDILPRDGNVNGNANDNANGNANDNDNSSNDNGNANGNANDNGNSNDNGSPPPLTALIEGLEEDVAVNPGTGVSFSVNLTGPVASATVNAFADPDDDPTSGNEIVIELNRPGADSVPFTWVVPELPPGFYRVFANAEAGDESVRAVATGRVRLNVQPIITLDSPREDTLVTIGRSITVSWVAQDDDDDAQITIYLDTNAAFDGNEVVLRSGVSEDDVEDREFELVTDTLLAQDYFIGAFIDDPAGRSFAAPVRLCLTTRLAGRFELEELTQGGRLTTIVADATSRALGTDIDISRDVNGDGRADLLLSDPRATDGTIEPVELGRVYFRAAADWPSIISVDDDIPLRLEGNVFESRTGERIALLPAIDGDPLGEFLIGAPNSSEGEAFDAGRVYLVNGAAAFTRPQIFLDSLSAPLGTYIQGDFQQHIGADVAAAGDLNGDGAADYAFGAIPNLQSGAFGGVYVISGGAIHPEGNVFDIGAGESLITGVGFEGSGDDLAGASLASLPDVNGDGLPEIVVGAPAGTLIESPPLGIVYVLFGDPELFSRYDDLSPDLDDVGDEIPGILIAGEQSGDLAGAALAAGDFNGNGIPDLAIGAPGVDDGRGRVYILYDLSDSTPPLVLLSDVGVETPGVIIEGIASGDRLGAALANAGDFDGDGNEDLAIGAPGVESDRGSVTVLYGAGLPTFIDLSLLATCDLQGFYVVGESVGGGLGSSLSGGGSVRGDTSSDIGVGAPTLDEAGGAYIIFGEQFLR